MRGCYRCLLSYFNQPDHELIDRTNAEAKSLLIAIARGTVTLTVGSAAMTSAPGPGWPAAFAAAGLPTFDPTPITLAGSTLPYAWRSSMTAAAPEAGVPQSLITALKG